MKALFDALNIVYDAKETRVLIKLNTVSLAFTSGALIVLLLAIGGGVSSRASIHRAGKLCRMDY
jgi:membrane protein